MLYDPKWERTSPIVKDLIAARHLIEAPESWSSNGGWGSDGRMCAAQAICVARGTTFSGGEAQKLLTKAAGVNYIGFFNDTHSHSEILELFDLAIAQARVLAEKVRD